MKYEEIESVQKLDELMAKIAEAKKASEDRQEEIDQINKYMRVEPNPIRIEEMKAKVEELTKLNEEMDSMTAPAIKEARKRLEAVRSSEEKRFNEELAVNASNRANARENANRFAVDEEAAKESIQEKIDKMQERAKEKAIREGVTPEEKAKLEAEAKNAKAEVDAAKLALSTATPDKEAEAQEAFIKAQEAFMKAEAAAKVKTVKEIKDEEFAKIERVSQGYLKKLELGTVNTSKETEYQKLLSNQEALRNKLNGYQGLLDEMKDIEDKYSKVTTAMEQYEQMQERYTQLKDMMKNKQAELDKINEDLAKDPDNAELKAKKATLEGEISKLETGEKTCEEKLEEYKKLLGIEDEEKGKGENGEGGEGKGENGEGGEGKGENGEGKDKYELTAKAYYKSLSYGDKYKTRVECYEKEKGKKANLFVKLWLLNPLAKRKLSIDYLEKGYMTPLYDTVKLLKEGEAPESVQKSEEKKIKPEEKNPWEVDKETKDKVQKAEQDAAVMKKIEEMMGELSEEKQADLQKIMKDIMTKEEPDSSKEEEMEK